MHLSMEEIEGSMENYMRGEVFSQVCFVYCGVCVCECVMCVMCVMCTELPMAGSVANHRGSGVHES